VARPCFVTQVVVAPPLRWHVFPRVVQGPHVAPFRPVPEANRRPIINSAPTTIHNTNGFARPIPEARRGPVISNVAPARPITPLPGRSVAPVRTVAPQMRAVPMAQPRWGNANSFSHSVSHSAARGASGGGGHRGRGRG